MVMTEKEWEAILQQEDRLIHNSDRRFRYHCCSLESMSEELAFQESALTFQEDFSQELFAQDYIETVRNEKLAHGLRQLTDRQRYVIELAFWQGYQYNEIAAILGCSPTAVTRLLQRAFKRLASHMTGK